MRQIRIRMMAAKVFEWGAIYYRSGGRAQKSSMM